jgi:hypothetical protein
VCRQVRYCRVEITAIGRHHEQPICHEPEYGIRAERTSVVGRFPGALVTDESPRERGAPRGRSGGRRWRRCWGCRPRTIWVRGPPRVGEALPAPDPEAALHGDCGERPGWVASRLSPGRSQHKGTAP